MTDHKQTSIYSQVFEEDIDIDSNISELIEILHKLKMTTFNSCEENQINTIWIQFSSESVERFLTICCQDKNSNSNSIYNDIIESIWDIKVDIEDIVINNNNPLLMWAISIRFPKDRYYEILYLCKKELKKKTLHDKY